MENLWGYALEGELTNQNAGYSMWGFGRKVGAQFFIKQFLSPKYPYNDTESSPERIERKKQECSLFVSKKKAVYKALNENSDGNDVRVREFFRVESRFYIAMDKVDALPWTIDTMAELPEAEKRRLCAIIAHAVAGLHKGRIVHADIKHENILYTNTSEGMVTAKIIDFDNSFLETDPPGMEEEIVGDFNYFAPEVCARAYGQTATLTCKVDVFALGVLFHQYFSGQLPTFKGEGCSCPGDAVYKGYAPKIHESVPSDVAILLVHMMENDPMKRPTAYEVFDALRPFAPSSPATKEATSNSQATPFKRAGDLL